MNPNINPWRLGRCCLCLLVLIPSLLAATSAQERRPLDPLTDEEKRIAERTALADARVKELLGSSRPQLVSVELFVVKVSREQVETAAAGRAIRMDRYAEVVFFRREGEFGVRAVVDLTSRAVTEATRLPSQEVPMTQADVAEAWELAKRDSQVREALGADLGRFVVQPPAGPRRAPYVVEALRIGATAEDDPCAKHRCLMLLFRRGAAYLVKPVITVDLSAQRVQVERKDQ